MKFALFGNTYQTKKSAHIATLLETLHAYGAELYIDREFYIFLPEELTRKYPPHGIFEGGDFDADMVISMGGDGTFLKSAMRVGNRNIPILGINTGRLGFLADISPEEIKETFHEICNGHYQVEDRSVLHLHNDGLPARGYPYALNEIAVLKRDSSSMISIHTHINGALLTTYQADGLVISTPTGSTAYSMSVNGPIIVPQSNSIVLSPVAPHSLNVRPLVIPDSDIITLRVESRNKYFLISLDGRSEIFPAGIELKMSKADYTTKVIKRYNHTFYQTLREKLMWGADVRMK